MNEYELQMLAAGSRYEFDVATLVYIAWIVAFMFLCRDGSDRWSARTGVLMSALYLAGGALMIVRAAASMVRYGRLIFLLAKLPPEYVLSNPSLQWPTLVIRITLCVIAPVVVLCLIQQRVKGG